MLAFLWVCDHPDRKKFAESIFATIDLQSIVLLVSLMFSQAPTTFSEELLAIISLRDEHLSRLLGDTLLCMQQDRQIIRIRRCTKSPRHRLFLAFILNLPDRCSIDTALKQVHPNATPNDWIWRTLRSMHDTTDDNGRNLLGVVLDDISKQALRSLVYGGSVTEAANRIAQCDELLDDSILLCSSLAEMPLVKPILRHRYLQASKALA